MTPPLFSQQQKQSRPLIVPRNGTTTVVQHETIEWALHAYIVGASGGGLIKTYPEKVVAKICPDCTQMLSSRNRAGGKGRGGGGEEKGRGEGGRGGGGGQRGGGASRDGGSLNLQRIHTRRICPTRHARRIYPTILPTMPDEYIRRNFRPCPTNISDDF